MENMNTFGEGSWIFGLLVLLGLFGGGGFGFGGNGGLAQTDLNLLNAIQNGQREIATDVQRVGYEGISATKDANYNTLGEVRDVQSAIGVGFANMQNCCCETNRNIDSVRFDMANYSAAVQATDTANTQKILDAITRNREADLQAQINQLQIQQAMCGIPKISTFGWGVYPYGNAPYMN